MGKEVGIICDTHQKKQLSPSLSLSCFSVTPGARGSAVHHLHTCRNTHTASNTKHICFSDCGRHVLPHINKQSNLPFFFKDHIFFTKKLPLTVRQIGMLSKWISIQLLPSLLRLVGCLSMYFPIAVLYQAGKLVHS